MIWIYTLHQRKKERKKEGILIYSLEAHLLSNYNVRVEKKVSMHGYIFFKYLNIIIQIYQFPMLTGLFQVCAKLLKCFALAV